MDGSRFAREIMSFNRAKFSDLVLPLPFTGYLLDLNVVNVLNVSHTI